MSRYKTVLVLTRDHGSRLAEGVRGFAVKSSVFDGASWWAKNSPITDPDLDWVEFIGRLQPRLPLRKQAWQQDGDLRRHAREIAVSLINLFGLDPDSIGEYARAKGVVRYDREIQSYGGDLLDMVLDQIRKTPSKAGEEDFPGRTPPHAPFPSVAEHPE